MVLTQSSLNRCLSMLIYIGLGLVTFHAQAGKPGPAMNLSLYRKVQSSSQSNELVSVFVKGNESVIRNYVGQHGGVFINAAGSISSVRIPVSGLTALLQQPTVERIEAYPHHYRPLNDTMRMLCRVEEVHQGQSPLSQAYDGEGVLLGFIDSGIDLHHPDFQDSLGHTRVQWLWDMNLPVSANTPQPYGYGQEWNAAQIDSGLAAAHTGEAEYGHGTYCTGIAAGNGSAVGHFQGVAPKSELIIVSFDFTSQDTVSRLAHAVEYIYTKAQQLGKPCVINASLGDYYGSHDGLDLESQYISNLISQQPGRVLVAAAGNVGVMYPFHVGRTSTVGDTMFSWFKYNAGIPGAYIQVFADTADFNPIRYSIGVDKVTPYYDFRGQTTFTTIASTINNVVNYTVSNGGNRIGRIQTLATVFSGVYSLEIYVIPDSTDYNWRFTTTGNGHYDSWTFDWAFQNLPTPTDYPPMVNYLPPDTTQSIVSGIACLDNVITVGNYYNTDRHVDVNGTLQISSGDKPRQIAENSSRGPTRDGRVKPDICAPGHHIISTGVLTLIPGLIAAQPYKVALGGYHITGGGTSASAPVVAGIAALFLQQNPGANWNDVKTAVLGCAAQDQYTWGPVPNNAWGYGKADAFGTLTNCSPVGIGPVTKEDASFELYPNPASGRVGILIGSIGTSFSNRILVTDLCGRQVKNISVAAEHSELDLTSLSPGIYLVKWIADGKVAGLRKLILASN